MRTSTRTVVAAVAAIATVMLAAGQAQAAPSDVSGPTTESVSETIEAVRPDLGTVIEPEDSVSGDLIASTSSEVSASVPEQADGAITIEMEGRAPLALQLPNQVSVEDATLADDGTIVYPAASGTAVSVAVQALATGEVSVQTVLESSDAPTSYTYSLEDGVTGVLRADGGVDLIRATDVGQFLVGEVSAPWAYDATGAPLKTSYTVDGASITQVVELTAHTVFPVVADPTWGHTYLIPTMYLTKAETRKASQDMDAVYLACAAAGVAFGPAIGLLCQGNAYLVKRNAGYAVKNGKCLKVLLSPAGVSTQEFSANCK